MATKTQTWNVTTVNGVTTRVDINAGKVVNSGKISINGGEEADLNAFLNPQESNKLENVYDIPLPDGEMVKLYRDNFGATLTYMGKDVLTGEEYTKAKVPGWLWVFLVIYVVEFLTMFNGALGGVLYACAFFIGYGICRKKNLSTGAKVGLNILILVLATLIAIARVVVYVLYQM